MGSNGAGDAFCAGIVYAMHEGLSLRESLRYGAASASFNLRSPSGFGGAATLQELRARLA